MFLKNGEKYMTNKKLVCRTCKKTQEKAKLDSEYGMYDNTIDIQVICLKCLTNDMKANLEYWNNLGLAWDTEFSHIEKLCYEQDTDFCSKDSNVTNSESVINKSFIEIEKINFFLAWRLSLSVKSMGLPQRILDKINKHTEKPTVTKGLPKELDHSNEIFSFIHCRKCIEENEPSMIECGWTKFGFRVMCRNHNEQITFFPLPPEMIPVGCECPKCKEKLK